MENSSDNIRESNYSGSRCSSIRESSCSGIMRERPCRYKKRVKSGRLLVIPFFKVGLLPYYNKTKAKLGEGKSDKIERKK